MAWVALSLSVCTYALVPGRAKTIEGRRARIVAKRKAFEFIPVAFSSDLVHGSWWMVTGSALSVLVPVPLLIDCFILFFTVPSDTDHKAFDEEATWILMIISNFFFALGSWIFIRAFEEPPPPPMLPQFTHTSTDELLGAWLYVIACLPSIPYSIVFLAYNYHRLTYWASLIASIFFALGCFFFVHACYPSHHHMLEQETHVILPLAKRIFGHKSWILTHVQTDWLAACWFFLFSSIWFSFGSYLFLFSEENDRQLYIWVTTCLNSVFYLMGSIYFVAGSYPFEPHAAEIDHDEVAAASRGLSGVGSGNRYSVVTSKIEPMGDPVVSALHMLDGDV